ncbi:MAG: 50S ribosomal protein L21 [Bryobacteraceae bacterium]
MYAVIQTGGKQYRVAPGDRVRVDTIKDEVGAKIELTGLLALANEDGKLLTGQDVANSKITATITRHGRAQKVIVFKFKRKKQYKRLYGHRQNFTEVTVDQVIA